MEDTNNMDRAIQFIKNFGERGIAVKLKADGSVPATLRPPKEGWDEARLKQYLEQEVRLSNFQDVLKRKGHASIFLVDEHSWSVIHIRVMHRSMTFYYID